MIGFAFGRFPRRVRATAVKELMVFHPVIHTRTLRPPSGSQFMSLSPSPHEDMDAHYVYEPSHTGNMLNLLSRLPRQPSGLDPSDDVENLHLYLRTLAVILSEDQFLFFYPVCLVYFFLLCSLFLSCKTSILWELEFYDVCDFH